MDNINYILDQIKKDNTINTYLNNKEAFNQFYFNNMSINRFGTQIIEIYKYILSCDINDDYDMPTLYDNIVDDFQQYEQDVTQNPYFKDCEIDDKYIKKYDELIYYYNELKKLDKNNKLLKEDFFIRDVTASMIICLNKSFFSLSTENILKLVNMIKNNDYLKKIMAKNEQMNWMDKDYFGQYITRFLFISEVMNIDELKDDLLIKAFINGEIKNKEIVKKIIGYIDINHIKYIFEDGLKTFIDILDKYYDNEYDKKDQFNIIYNKLLQKKEYSYLGHFIIHDERSKFYISQKDIEDILDLMSSDYVIDMDDEEVNYIMKYKAINHKINTLDLINLKENLDNSNWSEDTKQKFNEYLSKLPNIDYDINQAIGIIQAVFENQNVSEIQLFGAIKRLIKQYLGDETIHIYLVFSSTFKGCAYIDNNTIKINLSSIQKMVKCSDIKNNPDAIAVLDTMFHEARHLEQFKYMKQDEIPSKEFYKMYKENIVENLMSGYYENNYYGISYEKDARIEGKRLLIEFLKRNFPNMVECIDFYQEKLNKELSQNDDEKITFELSDKLTIDEILERLVLINPNIIEKNKHLKLEYSSFLGKMTFDNNNLQSEEIPSVKK